MDFVVQKRVRLLWALAAILVLVVVTARLADRSSSSTTSVLVAKQLIPAGTPARLLVRRQMVAFSNERADEGAIADPSYLAGRFAARDIFPGQQISVSDFSP